MALDKPPGFLRRITGGLVKVGLTMVFVTIKLSYTKLVSHSFQGVHRKSSDDLKEKEERPSQLLKATPFNKTGIFAQRARVDQAVGLFYRKENLTF